MSNRLSLTPGTSASFVIDLTDASGDPMTSDQLTGAVTQLRLRTIPTGSDVLHFTTPDATHLNLDIYQSTITVNFTVADTTGLSTGTYFYQIELDLSDGEVLIPINWTPVDVTVGGSAVPQSPVFSNTVALTQDYMLPGNLAYFSPGGTPIANAQIRVYQKSDYVQGNFSSPIGFTTTDARGNWVNPVLVPPGLTLTIRFEKPYEFGPDTVDVVSLSINP